MDMVIMTSDYDYNNNTYNTNQEFNKLKKENFTARLRQAKLAAKTDISDFVKVKDFYEKLKKIIGKLFQIK